MERHSMRPRLLVVLLMIAALGFTFSASAPPALRAQTEEPPTPTAEPAGEGDELYPVDPDSPLYGPTIDPRTLQDRENRQPTGIAHPQMELPASLLDKLRQSSDKTPKATNKDPAPEQSAACVQWILNPGLTDTNGDGVLSPSDGNNANWYTDIPIAGILPTSDPAYAPNAVILRDGDETSGAADIDMISQDMAFRSTDTDISIQFDLYQTANDPGFDFLYYGFATFNGPILNEFLYWNVVPDQTPGTWNTLYDRIDDPAMIQLLKNADLVGTGVWLVFFNSTDGVAPYVGSVIDNVYATSCNASSALSGSVKQANAATDAELLLGYSTYNSSGQLETFDIVGSETATNGSYTFSGLRPLAGNGSDDYQVFFSNDGSDNSRVSLWVGPVTTSLNGSASLASFDLANVSLSSPASEATTTLPATFSWASRGLSGEGYRFCIYDPDTFEAGCSSRRSSTSFQLTLSSMQALFGSSFGYDKRYAWYVMIEAANGDASQGYNYGYSFYERGVSFAAQAPTTPPPAPPPSGTPPSGTSKDWTVMIYIAGDNNLGDLARYPNAAANLQGQWATLKQLARSYPKVNIVTQTDFFDGSGTQFCHLKPDGSQSCQQLGEKDSSSPAVLATFISSAVSRFPATRTMLIIADHGHAVSGVAADETTGPTAVMDPAEIRQALDDGLTTKVDILFYSACLMGSFEAAASAAPFANYMVASADELWVLSVYERLLPLLSSTDARTVASGMVTAYKNSVQAQAPGYYISSAAYDLSKVGALNNALSQLGVAIADGLNSSQAELVRSTLNRIRNNVQVYDSSGNNLLDPREDAFVDLQHLATLLSDLPDAGNGNTVAELTDIKSAAAGVLSALDPTGTSNDFVIASQQISGGNGEGGTHDLSNARGLSVFMPNGNADDLNKGQQRAMASLYLNGTIYTPFNTTSQWDEALRLYTGLGSGSGPTGGPGRFVSGGLPVAGDVPQNSISLPIVRR